MKRVVLGAAALSALAACATTPTTTQLVLGTWNCESKASFGTIKSTNTYSPDGTGKAHLNVAGAVGAMNFEAVGDADATWKLLEEDTKIEQKISGVTVTSAKLNGNTIDPKMAQTMIGPYLAGQSAASAIKVDAKTLTLTGTDGSATNCTR